ncbi:hypothetical protein QQM39_45340 [Streptomyces sp. DT2A-34]|uniref:hypothetical protein n=1 Tax=Streptomyces sp. DT2A-34 TaxID=3051182 RepID=UPI00265C4CFD|nr:hypothetical protein [Streptomyces sp. DT2A-34]MDO0917754.1 hypothetical protein [Streptomyces sp. DT2A-34]
MSTRTTFEDRLLDGLKREIEQREIEQREVGTCPAGPGEAATGQGSPKASVRRKSKASVRPLSAPRRIAVVAVVCTGAWLATVVAPGSPTESTAYAVAPRDDGSVTLTVKDQSISVKAQRELAWKVRPWGIQVTVDVLAPGYVCERSKVTPLVGVDAHGNRVPVIPLKAGWDVTLRRGNVLAFENTKGGSRPRAVEFYKTEAEAEPCVPMKVALPER